MDAWPITLQQKLNTSGFQYQLGNTLLRSENDVGPAKVRSRFTDAVDRYTCTVLLDFDDVATFKTFYKTTLNNGANAFEFNDPFTGDPSIFRFVDSPTIRPLGGITFELNMSWERMPENE